MDILCVDIIELGNFDAICHYPIQVRVFIASGGAGIKNGRIDKTEIIRVEKKPSDSSHFRE